MPTPEKIQIVDQTRERIKDASGFFLADFTGMSVQKLSLLRQKCRQRQVQFRVIKNTLLKRAFNQNGITALDDYLAGPTGLVFSTADSVAPARILADFAKEHELPRLKAAVVDGRLFDEKAVMALAALPSREVLLAQLLSTFIAPMTQLLAAIEATITLPAVMADVLEREKSKAN
jgi:large subunit ribosomal protein L10